MLKTTEAKGYEQGVCTSTLRHVDSVPFTYPHVSPELCSDAFVQAVLALSHCEQATRRLEESSDRFRVEGQANFGCFKGHGVPFTQRERQKERAVMSTNGNKVLYLDLIQPKPLPSKERGHGQPVLIRVMRRLRVPPTRLKSMRPKGASIQIRLTFVALVQHEEPTSHSDLTAFQLYHLGHKAP